MSNWDELPLRVKVYISSVVLGALPFFVNALHSVIGVSNTDFQWLILTGITLVTVPIFVYLPSVRSLVTIGDAFVISICMLYGTENAIIANTLYLSYLTLLLKRRHDTPAHRIVFNIATGILSVALYGLAFTTLKSLGSKYFGDILLPAFGLALTYFLSNSLLVAGAIALSSRQGVLQVWWLNYPRLSLDFILSACAGAFIVLFEPLGRAVPLLVAPFVGAIWGINKVNRAKAIEAERHLREQERLYLRTVESLAMAVDAKDQTTYGHIRRVKAYAMGLARLCDVTDANDLMAIETGSLLHDIGKLAIDDYILNKPGKLTKQEFEKMKLHAAAGDEILQQIQFPFPVAKVVRYHHERWDGGGYPDGLKGEEIPVGARILAIADAYDAIRSTRPYKSSFAQQDAIELIRSQAGAVYDPRLAELFLANINRLESEAENAVQDIPKLSFRKYFEVVDRAIASADGETDNDKLAPSAAGELVGLFEFCSGPGKQLGLKEALSVMSGRIKRLLPFDTCVIFLRVNDRLVPAVASGEHASLFENLEIELGKGISGWVAAYKKPMLNATAALEFQDAALVVTHSLDDALAVPIIYDSDCIGTFSLYSTSLQEYLQSDLLILQAIANLSAPLIAHLTNAPNTQAELIDPVTQTYRVGYLSVAGPQLISQAEQKESPLSLLLLEVRGLAHVLSLYGVPTGDPLLLKVAEVLRAELRETDVLVRFGLEGFVALLPGVRSDQLARFCNRLQQLVSNVVLDTIRAQPGMIDIQLGSAFFPADGTTVFSLLQSAQHSIFLRGRPSERALAPNVERNILEFPPRL